MIEEYIPVATRDPKPWDIVPQDGFQTKFLECNMDMVVGGGAAGSGKTVALLIRATKGVEVPKYNALIFRKSYPQIFMPGGLWDESLGMYARMGAWPTESKARWIFPQGPSRIRFAYLSIDSDLDQYQGSQIPFIGFDELTHFSLKMFIHMLTRNRSAIMVKPQIRGTCNPDPDSWLADFLMWWIDQTTGFPDQSRAGKVRYFIVQNDIFIWGDSRDEVLHLVPEIVNDPLFRGTNPHNLVKSVTFIPGTIQDNPALIKSNPQYLASLLAQDEATQNRLLRGNWHIRTDKLGLFEYLAIGDMFTNIVPQPPGQKLYITCDHARFGRDLCVIGTWSGWKLIRIDVLKTSDTGKIVGVIQRVRAIMGGIPSSQILVDQDGSGVKDALGCRMFFGGGKAHGFNGKKVEHKNWRTQCVFYLAEERVNKHHIFVDLSEVYLHDPHETKIQTIDIAGRKRYIKELIRDDLRTIKRENPDRDGRKQITPKEIQKQALLNRSPDFLDMLMMRSEFDLRNPKYFS